jgi:hypothetical protein
LGTADHQHNNKRRGHATIRAPSSGSWRSRCEVSHRAVADGLSRLKRDMAVAAASCWWRTFQTTLVLLRPMSAAIRHRGERGRLQRTTITTKNPPLRLGRRPLEGGHLPDRSASPVGGPVWVNCGDPAVIREGQLHPSKPTNPPARSIVSSVPIADIWGTSLTTVAGFGASRPLLRISGNICSRSADRVGGVAPLAADPSQMIGKT